MRHKALQNLISSLLVIAIVILGTWIGRKIANPYSFREAGAAVNHSLGAPNMPSAPTPPLRSSNRLAQETSPYLQQHAHNPVDWYPWSAAAFARAKQEDKPVFLSIGYSSCHWCHVMERESFDNAKIAAILNEHFVCIKVDREQRPDIDQIYMNAVQMMTGSGGWPLSVFLTPEGQAFYGGTYFPPESRYGRPGFDQLLYAIAESWEKRRDELLASANKLTAILQGESTIPAHDPDVAVLRSTYEACKQSFDNRHGGFGNAPKFPQPAILSYLLRVWQRSRDPEALLMVTQTLEAMACGGIYDHLGGGFHRYATDAFWLVPHFEKMLYDQAQLIRIYVDAYRATKKADFARVAHETIDYVLRDMRDDQGAFYSAEDADSEGREGVFYVWTPTEIQSLLPEAKATRIMDVYGVTDQGNFEHGTSILNLKLPLEPETRESLAEARKVLLESRSRRVRPFRDEKIITAWNGMMIAALAEAGSALGESRYVEAATQAADYILQSMQVEGRLQRSSLQGRCSGPGYLDDYAFLAQGLLSLYEATLVPRWLLAADDLARQMVELFGDERGGALFLTGHDAERLLVRDKPQYDGALPSGNAVAAMVLFQLDRMMSNPVYRKSAMGIVSAAMANWHRAPMAHVALAAAFDYERGPTREITLAGDFQTATGRAMLDLLRQTYLPNTLLLHRPEGDEAVLLSRLAPYIKHQQALDAKPTAYVCENAACRAPVQAMDQLAALLTPRAASD